MFKWSKIIQEYVPFIKSILACFRSQEAIALKLCFVQFFYSAALGQGWRLGFLGLLHMDVFKQRLSQVYILFSKILKPFVCITIFIFVSFLWFKSLFLVWKSSFFKFINIKIFFATEWRHDKGEVRGTYPNKNKTFITKVV